MEDGDDQSLENLSRRERRRLFRQEHKQQGEKESFLKSLGKWVAIFVGISIIGWGGYYLYKSSSKPLPGQEVSEMGRNHVSDIYGVSYNSNPPTSGPHFPVWAKPGIYDRFISDGYLIHSMEHGYVVIWYDCTKSISNYQFLISNAYAHDEPAAESTASGQLLTHMKVTPTGDMSWFTPQNPPEVEIELPESFKSESCKSLVQDLSPFIKVAQRVIVVPKQNLDSLIALTAWRRIDKLDSVDARRIESFIKTFHNHGPEQTKE